MQRRDDPVELAKYEALQRQAKGCLADLEHLKHYPNIDGIKQNAYVAINQVVLHRKAATLTSKCEELKGVVDNLRYNYLNIQAALYLAELVDHPRVFEVMPDFIDQIAAAVTLTYKCDELERIVIELRRIVVSEVRTISEEGEVKLSAPVRIKVASRVIDRAALAAKSREYKDLMKQADGYLVELQKHPLKNVMTLMMQNVSHSTTQNSLETLTSACKHLEHFVSELCRMVEEQGEVKLPAPAETEVIDLPAELAAREKAALTAREKAALTAKTLAAKSTEPDVEVKPSALVLGRGYAKLKQQNVIEAISIIHEFQKYMLITMYLDKINKLRQSPLPYPDWRKEMKGILRAAHIEYYPAWVNHFMKEVVKMLKNDPDKAQKLSHIKQVAVLPFEQVLKDVINKSLHTDVLMEACQDFERSVKKIMKSPTPSVTSPGLGTTFPQASPNTATDTSSAASPANLQYRVP